MTDARTSIKMNAMYLNRAFGDIKSIADDLREQVGPVSYDTLVGTGLSGALVVPRLAGLLGKKWAIVRKGEQTHSNLPLEGEIGQKWLFVDDCIDSGKTLARVKKVIRQVCDNDDFWTRYVGSFEYYSNRFILNKKADSGLSDNWDEECTCSSCAEFRQMA